MIFSVSKRRSIPVGRLFILLLSYISVSPSVRAENLLDFVYVDANTGQSSGGHSALRIDDTIYHFQYYPDEIFRLIREPYERFSYSYNVYSNRSSKIVRFSLPNEGWEKIRSGFDRLSLQQFKHLSNLESMRSDTLFLKEILSADRKVSVPASGYFRETPDSELTKELSERLRTELGNSWLGKVRSKIKSELFQAAKEGRFSDFPRYPSVDPKTYPFYGGGPSDWFLVRLEKLSFLHAVETGSSLNTEASFSPISATINDREREQLKDLKESLIVSLLASLREDSLDWGYPALVSLARILAIEESLNSGKLHFLITFPPFADTVSQENIRENIALAEKASEELYTAATHFRETLNSLQDLSEEEYRKWEDLENRAFELRSGLTRKISVRNTFEKLLPTLPAKITYSFPLPEEAELKKSLRSSEEREKEYYNSLKYLYRFHILRKNCTTEIFDSLETILSGEEYTKWLGQKVNPRRSLSFIPFVAYNRVKNDWNFRSEESVLSYRKRRLEFMSRTESSLLVSLRESNTVSSTIYESNPEDSSFLFFTDDVFFVRPIYGIANIGYGLGNGIFGVFTLPFDGGKRLKSGFQSAFFSLPELAFFNIRKGSFPKVSPKETPKATPTDSESDKTDNRP
ncbi:hypothetical protein LEP1GSC047_2407 [Leptospira inadai serovar Lyme str. 10]|uniref:Uncharacterized protein n=2 Tax=Leptospira inadai serovar Lyme TaxID=293084 RepID=V6HDY1_9LEPT|nr:hypothetical protein [Leptospira inadai]EQA38446.1 hypothetical protein LEP1GSC047_2407 [Leptospira inadai serovar Lyme str. 10]PNV75246.1 hypothetical protein BES34_010230 [Leptospira inadai serovar Lyme]